MNEKANVSKEQNAKNTKILEGLLKLPENRECADCKTKAPRWASVNLGIFVCMQCSGIHRSLGVHISKVRSATLDTWLPDQVAFIQSMGNDKSNSYWEAELPPKYDRVGIENFIRAKYDDKRWIRREKSEKSSSTVREERALGSRPKPVRSGEHGYTSNAAQQVSEERKITHTPNTTNATFSASESSNQMPSNTSLQASSIVKSQKNVPRPDPVVSKVETNKQQGKGNPVASPPKIDYATDLFHMLSMDECRENQPQTSSDNTAWIGFQSAKSTPDAEKSTLPNLKDSKIDSKTGIEDLFKNVWSATPSLPMKQSNDPKNDIINLFDKSSIASPFSVHQQQLAMLGQRQSFQIPAASKSNGMPQTLSSNIHQPESNGYNLHTQHWGIIGNQVPQQGMMPTSHHQKHMQAAHIAGISAPFPVSSMYSTRPVAPVYGSTPAVTSRPPPASLVSPSPGIPTRSIYDYDFSSLTQGMLAKR